MPIEIMELVIKASVAAAGSEPTPAAGAGASADENGAAGEAEQLTQQLLDILKRKNER